MSTNITFLPADNHCEGATVSPASFPAFQLTIRLLGIPRDRAHEPHRKEPQPCAPRAARAIQRVWNVRAREFGVNGTIGLAMHICFALFTNFHLPPSTGQIRLVLLAYPRMSEAKVYAVVGGSNSGVYNRSPHLSAASGSPILPIVIKCNTHGEAKKAAGLHAVLEHLRSETAQDNPQDFAKAIANSNHILPLFPSGGPFYAVYSGKNERAIYLNLFVPQ
ncbi:hypothetical protein B0H11DRAFT_1908568 [Mycena galericulata]|nr:hypothetical protein B0H11DRAFT_1908568 [Mycena galericulata]